MPDRSNAVVCSSVAVVGVLGHCCLFAHQNEIAKIIQASESLQQQYTAVYRVQSTGSTYTRPSSVPSVLCTITAVMQSKADVNEYTTLVQTTTDFQQSSRFNKNTE